MLFCAKNGCGRWARKGMKSTGEPWYCFQHISHHDSAATVVVRCGANGCARRGKIQKPSATEAAPTWYCFQHLSWVDAEAKVIASKRPLVRVFCAAAGCRRRLRIKGDAQPTSPLYCFQHLKRVVEDAEENNDGSDSEAGPEMPLDKCSVCLSSAEPAKLMLCEALDCGVRTHTHCATPAMPFVPTGAWYCEAHCEEGDIKLYPNPGDKLMVLVRNDMRWWPAVMLPPQAAYLPPTLPRRGGGMLEKPSKSFPRRCQTRGTTQGKAQGGARGRGRGCDSQRTEASQHAAGAAHAVASSPPRRRTVIVAYYGQPFSAHSAFAAVRLDLDKAKPLNFASSYFEHPTPALRTALRLARRYDLDLSAAASFALLRAGDAPAVAPVGAGLRTRLLYHLADAASHLQAFCKAHDLHYPTARLWLCRSAAFAADAERSLAVLAGVRRAVAGPPLPDSQESSQNTQAGDGHAAAGSPPATGRKRSWGDAAEELDADAPACKKPRVCVRDIAGMFERQHTPLGALLLKFLRACLDARRAAAPVPRVSHGRGLDDGCDDGAEVAAAFEVTHGISSEALLAWVEGKTACAHEAAYIERVAKHVLGWHVGFPVVQEVEESGLQAIPRVIDPAVLS